MLQKTVCRGKSSAAKRSLHAKKAVAATPLRQVMSKSIQRALREQYTKSPLDLRMSPAVRRSSIENHSPPKQNFNKSAKAIDEISTPEMIVPIRKRRSIELRSGSILETVYETVKATDIADDCENRNETNVLNESPANEKTIAQGKSNAADEVAAANTSLEETPMSGRAQYANIRNDNGLENVDVWYTPCENIPINPIEKTKTIETYVSSN